MVVAQQIANLFQTLKDGVRGFVPLVILIVLTLIGGFMFMAIEGPNEEYELRNKIIDRQRLLDDTAFKLNTIKSMTAIQAYNHTVKTLEEYREKLGVPVVMMNQTKWNFWGAIYYSMTVYTTIGYGNIVVKTTIGRILTVLYAFIGIPVALISLFALGGLFARFCMFIWGFLIRTTRCFSKDLSRQMKKIGPDETASENDDSSEDLLRFPLSLLLAMTIGWVLFCAYVFTCWEEEWDYGTSLYFTLISFLTIGFGDILPSESDYILLIGILLLVGLALVSTLLQIIQKQIEALASGMKDSIDKEYMNALQEAQDEGEVDLAEVNLNESAPGDESKADPEKGKKAKAPQKQVDPRSLEAVVKRMPWQKRMMFHVMSDSNKKQLNKHAKARQRYVCRGVQTEDNLAKGAVS
ncbi:hypothetical protein FO519_008895 [Halicephalobus sp. NKZ332]|nr:hypothetical protein FO519_008895 [Halicephalobus sp. NKZ332]